jgi:hypothetical protein
VPSEVRDAASGRLTRLRVSRFGQGEQPPEGLDVGVGACRGWRPRRREHVPEPGGARADAGVDAGPCRPLRSRQRMWPVLPVVAVGRAGRGVRRRGRTAGRVEGDHQRCVTRASLVCHAHPERRLGDRIELAELPEGEPAAGGGGMERAVPGDACGCVGTQQTIGASSRPTRPDPRTAATGSGISGGMEPVRVAGRPFAEGIR